MLPIQNHPVPARIEQRNRARRQPPITPYAGIIGAVESKLYGHNTHDGDEAINSDMRCHWNAAGRMRITFRRKDLLEAINAQIALAFGQQAETETVEQ